MRLLHTADWHLGRHFCGWSLDRDHDHVLDQLLTAIHRHAPDVLVIAGDIFDRAAPPERAVRQFNDFIHRVAHDTATAIVLIAGNHDSGDRIGTMSMLADPRRALIRGPVRNEEQPLLLQDAHGPVAISALPFANEYAARECFGTTAIESPCDVIAAQLTAARRHVPDGTRWIVTAHAFVAGAAPSSGERSLSRNVGGIETVPAGLFDGAHYVALGHLHRPQAVAGDRIRYSGSPLAFDFDDGDETKSIVLVDMAADGSVETCLIPFTPLRKARTISGALDDILATGRDIPSGDFFRVVLTDPDRRIDAMKRIREVYPRACTLSYARDEILETKSAVRGATHAADPVTVLAEFVTFTRGRPPTQAEEIAINERFAALAADEADAAA